MAYKLFIIKNLSWLILKNPDRSARIDANGDIFTRFNEGSPALSTFGGIITESPETSRQYVYAYDERPGEFYDVEVGAGTLSYLANERAVLLDTKWNSKWRWGY
jgi:hypothetical protein